MKTIYETFEFNLIKEDLKKYAVTELGKLYCENISMFDNKDSLIEALDELKEGMHYCYKYSKPNLYYHPNLIPNLMNLKKGGIGNKEFFYQVSYLLENINIIKEEAKEESNFPLLFSIINNLKPLNQVKQRIDRIISPTLEILDSASPNLYRIRSKITSLENSISSLSNRLVDKYRNYLSDGHGALKNGIFTLMVKATYKNRVPGIVHAISDTGQTIFIEPQELIEVYNNIASLKEEEIQEIQTILRDLSIYIANFNDDLLLNNNLIAKLDFILAKATYGISYHGEICNISSKKCIKLYNAAHPLIDKNKVVRNDFIMEEEKMLIITGPNAGGKTVALKVVGLLVIMHQCGLSIPVNEGGELSFFDDIYADIGDNQSLLDNLSTFSSHMVNIEKILEKANKNSLVIIDELGSGTSPLDGEALGLGVIDYLLNIGCFSFISSHYEAIKSYALENPSILCSSMVFNEEEIKPTYKLLLHVASSSYGIEVAYRLGLKDEVIKRAKEYIENRKLNDKEIKLESLNKLINETEQLKLTLKDKEREIDALKLKLNEEINHNKEIRKNILSEVEVEKQKMIEEAKIEIDNIFKEFKNLENIKMHQVIDAKRNLDNKTIQDDDDDEGEACVVNVGDYVEITESKVRGKVIYLKKDHVGVLTEQGLNIETKLTKIRKCEKIKKVKNLKSTPDIIANLKAVKVECNVIGLTVKEAIEIVSKYLDDCVRVHYHQVRIIHGSGTGKLRMGIQEYLKKSPYVESFRFGGAGEGGVGATVVTLK